MKSEYWNIIKEVATSLNIPEGTFRVWKTRGNVPSSWHFQFVQKAQELDLTLSYEDLNGIKAEAAK